jgi:predicted CoA-binding protein
VSSADEILRDARGVLVVDWPSADVPESLARAGYKVYVKGGPGPRDFTVRELDGNDVVARPLGDRPERVDVVYAHRPLGELAGIVELGKQLGARVLWWQTGLSGPEVKDPRGCWVPQEDSRQARALAEAAGLSYVDDAYIVDAIQ